MVKVVRVPGTSRTGYSACHRILQRIERAMRSPAPSRYEASRLAAATPGHGIALPGRFKQGRTGNFHRALCLMLSLVLAGCSTSAPAGSSSRAVTVLELGSTSGAWTGLDPLTNLTASINHDYFNAVYGQLFVRGAGNRVVPELATGVIVRHNGLEVDLMLRPGVVFSDGTPFDAAAVVFNLRRDLAPAAGCRCLANFADVTSVSAIGRVEVVLRLSRPDPLIVDAFIDAAPNWIVSPTALRRLGDAAFSIRPVGAGPFTVVSDVLNSSLELVANRRYWHKGYPQLDRLTFRSIADDTTAYSALRAGQAQVYVAFGTPALLPRMRSHFAVIASPAGQTEAINLNARATPFEKSSARQALYYATDAPAINRYVFKGAGTVSESPGGPADLYWNAAVPGYRTYDPARARAIVARLGGLSFTLSALNTPIQLAIVEALQGQWAKAGITAKIDLISIPRAVQESHAGTLQAIATQVGSFNPALMPGLAASYSSAGPFSLIRDPALDKLIGDAAAESDPTLAGTKYQRVYAELSRSAYAPFLFTMNQWNVAARSIRGLSAQTVEVNWEDVSRS